MLSDIWPTILEAIRSYFQFFVESPPAIPQITTLTAYAARNKDIIANSLDLISFLMVTPELARRLIPSRKMVFQNYIMIFITLFPLICLYRAIAWLIAGYYWHAGLWGFLFAASFNGFIQNWRHDASVVSPLLIGEKVSKALLPLGVALFLLSRVFELYVASDGG
jgi:hypothetical protein